MNKTSTQSSSDIGLCNINSSSTMSNTTNNDKKSTPIKKLTLIPLIAFAISGMLGSGIFTLPSQMAAQAAPGPLFMGWTITGFGMLMLTLSFYSLNRTRPNITGGVYGYAREGFGNFAGFSSAWSYWISACASNISYIVILVAAISNFAPFHFLKQGDSLSIWGIIVGLVILWTLHALILAGLRTATFVNTVITVVKIIPIIVFIVCTIAVFNAHLFMQDFWGTHVTIPTSAHATKSIGGTITQISSMMLITVWAFIGVEGVSVYSEKAQRQSDVRKATIISFLTALFLLVFVTVLSYGVIPQDQLAQLPDPSMGAILEHILGPFGSALINLTVIISVTGALLTWIMLAAEILYLPAQDNNMPRSFISSTRKESPKVSLWTTNIVSTVLFIAMILLFSSTYTQLISVASSLILPCYVFSSLFHLQTVRKQQVSDTSGKKRYYSQYAIAICSTLYTFWLLYAGGIGLIFLNGLIWLLGIPLFIYGRKQKNTDITTGVNNNTKRNNTNLLSLISRRDIKFIMLSIVLTIALVLWVILMHGDIFTVLFYNGL